MMLFYLFEISDSKIIPGHKAEENPALCDSASSVCSRRSLTHLPHMSPASEGRQWGPAIVLQLLRILFFFPARKELSFVW
uniref:Uncharacterized protein n=1 Tax=Serinus canaria TaxID=9135 RepID=A0A8C9MFK1_SERCA